MIITAADSEGLVAAGVAGWLTDLLRRSLLRSDRTGLQSIILAGTLLLRCRRWREKNKVAFGRRLLSRMKPFDLNSCAVCFADTNDKRQAGDGRRKQNHRRH